MMDPEIEEIATALVKEYLSSKGLKNSLQWLEHEKPRTSKSISRRSILAKKLHIEKLYKRNKKQEKPCQSIMEVIVKHFVEMPSNGVVTASIADKSFLEAKPIVPSRIDPTLGSGSWSSEFDTPSEGSSVSSDISSAHSIRLPETSKQKSAEDTLCQLAKVEDLGNSGNDPKFVSTSTNEIIVTDQQTATDLLRSSDECHQEATGDKLLNSSLLASSSTSRMMPSEDVTVVDLDEDDLAQGILLNAPMAPPIFKLSGTWITGMGAKEIKTLMFGKSLNFNEEWRMQNFSFSEADNLAFGLVQKKGGPCGVLACVQSFILRELIFSDKGSSVGLSPGGSEQDQALTAAISRILWKAGQEERAIVAVPKRKNKDSEGKSDDITESLMLYEMRSLGDTQECVSHHLKVFKEDGQFGCIAFLYSAVLSRGIKNVHSDMDEPDGKLVGAHGYCTQEMVNLLLTGKAVSNVFDGILELDSGGKEKCILRGIESQSEIGFLSLFEHYDSCKVGENFKCPKFPIWVVCSESHFTVLFSTNVRVASALYEFQHFTLYYYDGFGQDCEIRLLIDTNVNKQKRMTNRSVDDYRTPPLEHCIHTKWPDCLVRWEGCEPLL